MAEIQQEYLIFLVIALVVAIGLVWWLLLTSRRTKIQRDDTADDGPTKRNQALIDAPAASVGPVSAAAGLDRVAVATAQTSTGIGTAEASAPATKGDDLRRIKGLGPKLVTLLAEHGVTSFAQIAAWDDADIDRIDARLGRFQGRIRRDDWVAQARLLAAEDTAGYEAKFGNLQ